MYLWRVTAATGERAACGTIATYHMAASNDPSVRESALCLTRCERGYQKS
jgi:hypothetical protein